MVEEAVPSVACPDCGRPVVGGADWCGHCGARLCTTDSSGTPTAADVRAPEAEPQRPVGVAVEESDGSRRRRHWRPHPWTSVAAIVALVLSLGVTQFVRGDRDTTPVDSVPELDTTRWRVAIDQPVAREPRTHIVGDVVLVMTSNEVRGFSLADGTGLWQRRGRSFSFQIGPSVVELFGSGGREFVHLETGQVVTGLEPTAELVAQDATAMVEWERSTRVVRHRAVPSGVVRWETSVDLDEVLPLGQVVDDHVLLIGRRGEQDRVTVLGPEGDVLLDAASDPDGVGRIMSVGQALLPGGRLLWAANGQVELVDLETGQVEATDLDERGLTPMVVSAGLLLAVGETAEDLHALDLATFAERWTTKGHLVGTSDHDLRPDVGFLLVQKRSRSSLAVDPSTGLVVGTDEPNASFDRDGHVRADASTLQRRSADDRLVWHTPLREPPSDVGVATLADGTVLVVLPEAYGVIGDHGIIDRGFRRVPGRAANVPLAVAADGALIEILDSRIRRLAAPDELPVWSRDLRKPIEAVATSGDRIAFSDGEIVVVLDATDGSVIRQVGMAGVTSLGVHDGGVVVVDRGGDVVLLDEDLDERWSVPIVPCGPAAAGRDAVAVPVEGEVVFLGRDDGRERGRWELDAPGCPRISAHESGFVAALGPEVHLGMSNHVPDVVALGVGTTTSAAVRGRTAIIGCEDRVVAIDLDAAVILWDKLVPDVVRSVPVVDAEGVTVVAGHELLRLEPSAVRRAQPETSG